MYLLKGMQKWIYLKREKKWMLMRSEVLLGDKRKTLLPGNNWLHAWRWKMHSTFSFAAQTFSWPSINGAVWFNNRYRWNLKRFLWNFYFLVHFVSEPKKRPVSFCTNKNLHLISIGWMLSVLANVFFPKRRKGVLRKKNTIAIL